MAAYAVVARIDRVKPHFVGHGSLSGPAWTAPEPVDPPEAIDLVGRPLIPLMPLVAERWTVLREAWSQTTFYLFHAEGWR